MKQYLIEFEPVHELVGMVTLKDAGGIELIEEHRYIITEIQLKALEAIKVPFKTIKVLFG